MNKKNNINKSNFEEGVSVEVPREKYTEYISTLNKCIKTFKENDEIPEGELGVFFWHYKLLNDEIILYKHHKTKIPKKIVKALNDLSVTLTRLVHVTDNEEYIKLLGWINQTRHSMHNS